MSPTGVLPAASERHPAYPPLGVAEVMAKAADENFPVAFALLSRRDRERLLAIYGFARFVDDLGDELVGDRLAALSWAGEELKRALRGEAGHAVFAAAGRLADEVGVGAGPFVALIEANVLDQTKTTYATYGELLDYCALSANPVGHLVLAAFGHDDPRRRALSDEVCSGLQIVEHLQDVAEDARRGRVYLPEEDLDAFGVARPELEAATASRALRRLIAFEAARARGLLRSGVELVSSFSGMQALALSGFVGGGLAQLQAMERAGFDVLANTVKASKPLVAAKSGSVFVRGLRSR